VTWATDNCRGQADDRGARPWRPQPAPADGSHRPARAKEFHKEHNAAVRAAVLLPGAAAGQPCTSPFNVRFAPIWYQVDERRGAWAESATHACMFLTRLQLRARLGCYEHRSACVACTAALAWHSTCDTHRSQRRLGRCCFAAAACIQSGNSHPLFCWAPSSLVPSALGPVSAH
jgi:hypothetical protein